MNPPVTFTMTREISSLLVVVVVVVVVFCPLISRSFIVFCDYTDGSDECIDSLSCLIAQQQLYKLAVFEYLIHFPLIT